MIEVRKVLRAWLSGSGYPTVAARAGVDRKTARHYVDAAVAAGLGRECGVDQRSDELIGAVVAAVRPDRPHGYGVAWELLCANHDQIEGWVKKGLSVVKIVNLLARRGHMFVWLAFSQTLQAVIDGCEAAWRLFGGVFRVLIPDNIEYCCGPCRFGEPEVHRRLAGIQPSSRLRDRPGAGGPPAGQPARRADGAVRAEQLLRRGGLHRSGRRPGVVRREGRPTHPHQHLCPPGGILKAAAAS